MPPRPRRVGAHAAAALRAPFSALRAPAAGGQEANGSKGFARAARRGAAPPHASRAGRAAHHIARCCTLRGARRALTAGRRRAQLDQHDDALMDAILDEIEAL